MSIEYFLAPNAKWQGRDATGNPLVGGHVYTYVAGSLTIGKATYQDPFGVNPNPQPVTLDGKGEANIYWSNDSLYQIAVYSVDPNSGLETLIYTQDNYPSVNFISPVNTTSLSQFNLVRNPQFFYWSNSTDYPNVTQSANNYDFISDDWLFIRNNLNATIELKQQTFALGQSVIPGNPVYYFEYICTVGGSSETSKYLGQRFNSVQTLAGQTVAVGFWAKASSVGIPFSCSFLQYFGSGGSPSSSVITPAVSGISLTTAWTFYNAFVVIPNVNNMAIGTDGTDALILQFNFPLNQPATIDIANVQLQSTATSFPYQSNNDQFKRLDNRITEAVWQTGDVKTTFRNSVNQPDPGWLYMDDTNIGSPGSTATHRGLFVKALYELLWNNVADTYAPVTGGRGASAEVDFNLNKNMALTKMLGRALSSTGQPSAGGSSTTWALGQTTGEEQHTLTTGEVPNLNVSISQTVRLGSPTGPGNIVTATGSTAGTLVMTGATTNGGGLAHNTIQPTAYVNVMIKL